MLTKYVDNAGEFAAATCGFMRLEGMLDDSSKMQDLNVGNTITYSAGFKVMPGT
jgi:hypothetical protein